MSTLRCEEPGWVEVTMADSRRGLWIRETDGKIEVCGGREGDDVYLSFSVGETLTAEHLRTFRDLMWTYAANVEFAREE